jgi:methyl-accepting chemotaxis protein WspA
VKLILRRKIIALVLFAAILPLLVTQLAVFQFKKTLSERTEAELDTLGREALGQIVSDIYSLCNTSNDLIQDKVDRSQKVAWAMLNKEGPPILGNDKATWTALDQFSKKSIKITLPKMMLGAKWLGQESNFSNIVPVVDEVKKLVGGACTIFQRMNEDGDMLRVATNVATTNQQRAIGTYIPAIKPDGTKGEIVAAIMKGQPYKGIAWVVNAWYIASYEPIFDTENRIIGMLFVGEQLESVPSLRKNIQSVSVGETGRVLIFGGKGDQKGKYLVTSDGKKEGENGWFTKDSDGKYVAQEIINAAMSSSEVIAHHYMYSEPGSGRPPRKKIAIAKYFEYWDWVIVAATYEDEYYSAKKGVETISGNFTQNILLWTGGILVITLIIAFYFSQKIANPISRLIGSVEKIAMGDLKGGNEELELFEMSRKNTSSWRAKLKIDDRDESVILVLSVKKMAANLFSLLSKVGNSGMQVNSSATEISASARELEATVAEQAASIKEVSATAKEILQTSNTLLKSLEENIGSGVKIASETAEDGRDNLNTLEEAMLQLIKATNSISAKLAVINSKANKISSVVTAINKISDQTNLLSLNAAIEAEKAGEFGKGFSVVAREISRLADQTAVATHDIEHMVREMQSSVSSGVMEMDKFSEEVRQDSVTVSSISERLNEVINNVNSLAPHFEEFSYGMKRQTEGADQISEAMQQLSVAAEQTKDSLQEFRAATGQLTSAVTILNDELQRFKVS